MPAPADRHDWTPRADRADDFDHPGGPEHAERSDRRSGERAEPPRRAGRRGRPEPGGRAADPHTRSNEPLAYFTDAPAHPGERRRQRGESAAGVEDTDIVSTAVVAMPGLRGPADPHHAERARGRVRDRETGEPALPDDFDEEPVEEEHSTANEWFVVLAQLAAGAVAGAALWLVFRWLWRSTPAAAAVVGVLMTVGAVLLVRRIWRSDDLRTTVMTVLIGLFVTMSPAVLLLDL